jgi:DNA-binding MarR family transcriptional regulator
MQEASSSSRSNDMTRDEADGNNFTAIARALDDWYTLLGRQFGPLSRPQRRMLRLLSLEKAVRVGDLAEALGLTTAGATRMLDKLTGMGYALRTRDPSSDQRQVYVRLTETGQQALDAADAIFLKRVQETLNALNETERATLAGLLYKMRDAATKGE